MKNILVTGGAGYIGSHMVLELVNKGYTPVILDNFSNSTRQNIFTIEKITGAKLEVVEWDLKTPLDSIKLPKIDCIVHFGALKAVGESVEKPIEYYRNNVTGSINLISYAKKKEIKNIVFSSTAAVYGNPPTKQVNEDTPTNPVSPYAFSKLMIERVLNDSSLAYGLNVVVFRYFNVAGNVENGLIGDTQLTCQNLIPSIILSHLGIRKTELNVYGNDYPTRDGTGVRDYIHVLDLIDAHIRAIDFLEENAGFHQFNLGTGKGFSVLEIINKFEEISKQKVKYKVVERRPGDISQITTDSSKALKTLGWKAKRDLCEMIESSYKWYKSNFIY